MKESPPPGEKRPEGFFGLIAHETALKGGQQTLHVFGAGVGGQWHIEGVENIVKDAWYLLTMLPTGGLLAGSFGLLSGEAPHVGLRHSRYEATIRLTRTYESCSAHAGCLSGKKEASMHGLPPRFLEN
ncbi:MAG: hypothetical protein FWC28_00425 [Proteobacteria bacterium]|nr:hypothetical protein [Cystobacterineae bacterium]MCL2259701.1 hypothetical protein [Cystobacterineae bacterium]MCL2313707.1 hypothetical protein [Pseudomonadota bacterium]